MGTFDPKKQAEEGLPSFEGIIALVWFETKTSAAGNRYMRGKYEVCAGDHAGKTFFANQSLDPSKSGARLSVWCSAVGHEEAFDLDDDKAIADVWLNKPFKATVERKVNGEYVNHDIKKMVFASKLTDADREAMRNWLLDLEEDRALNGGDDDEGDDDIPF